MDHSSISDSVLTWLETMRVAPARYLMNAGADDTYFTTCFALYIIDLFGGTDRLSAEERQQWVSRIQSAQDPRDGLFKLPEELHADPERSRHQLTCFSLSALRILSAEPLYPLAFLEAWSSPDEVRDYLAACGCHQGRPGSGNKAMFLGIFLTRAWEQTGEERYRSLLEAWFQFHDEQQNAHGLWGDDRQSLYLHGIQNGLHQLAVYFYWKREHRALDRVVDAALTIQDRDGFFSSTPGGIGCHDFDAIHILATAHGLSAYRHADIEAALRSAAGALLTTRNPDGGFCQSKKTVDTAGQLLQRVPGFFCGRHPYLWYYRARKSAGVFSRGKQVINTGWTQTGRRWTDSNLWDTWFRCLALAEIEAVLPTPEGQGFSRCRFHDMIGLGHFRTGGDQT